MIIKFGRQLIESKDVNCKFLELTDRLNEQKSPKLCWTLWDIFQARIGQEEENLREEVVQKNEDITPTRLVEEVLLKYDRCDKLQRSCLWFRPLSGQKKLRKMISETKKKLAEKVKEYNIQRLNKGEETCPA